jgi:uncharacterized protein YndB with AHSA1/START domain
MAEGPESRVPDRIEKEIVLRAPIARVWKAISDSKEFGRWFGVAFDAPFAVGGRATGRIVGTEVDADVAKMQEPYRDRDFEFTVERMEPMRLFSFRWHPFAVEEGYDYSGEPTTLVVFELAEVSGGTRLRITESGFDRIPAARRAQAFRANDGGWTHQARLVAAYVEREAR